MQNYTEISENQTLRDSRSLLLNNDKTAMSNSSGESFPTQNLQVGMFCYRTDEKKLYQLMDNMPTWKLVVDMSGDGAKVAQVDKDGVNEDALQDEAVTENKILNKAVSTEKLADEAVTGKKVDILSLRSYIVAATPRYYARAEVPAASARTIISIPSDIWININNNGYVINGGTDIDINVSDNWDNATYATAQNRKGKDFYMYACIGDNGIKLVLSANSTVPTGYNANTSRKIGGFHCLCANVGSITGHTLSGYVAGDIIPGSVWDLLHRAKSDNVGMVYHEGLGIWADIYGASWDGSKLTSVYGGIFADGESAKRFHGELFVEEFGKIGKRLISRAEFQVLAKGSNECTNISGSADPGTTGGHVDTAGRRMISNFGLEDCCGAMWSWTSDLLENYPGSVWNSANYYLDSYAWQERSVYNPDIDSQKYGSCPGLLRRCLVGGDWSSGSFCGSRAADCIIFSSCRNASFGGRAVSEPRVVHLG